MSSYEQQHGKVCLHDEWGRHRPFDVHGRPLVPSSGADGTQSLAQYTSSSLNKSVSTNNNNKMSPLQLYGEWYRQPYVGAITTVDQFHTYAKDGGRESEASLWFLVREVLQDAQRAEGYHPDVINIANTQPHRRWFISQYAHIQDTLQRHRVLRHAAIICSWLEHVFRDNRQQAKISGEEDVVLRQTLLTYIRGGELHKAEEAAVHYRDGSYSCVLSAARLQTVPEPWFTQTALVPLFGEYAHGELDQAWTGNEHRLDNLSQLYEDSLQQSVAHTRRNARDGFDAVIGAALCGNLDVLEPAFAASNSWKDTCWCYLRCFLTVAFTKTLMNANVPVDGPYAAFVETQTGGDDAWLDMYATRMVRSLTEHLHSSFMSKVPLEEQLQMRFVLQSLSPHNAEWFNITPEPNHSEASRLITHALLILDAAYVDTLCQHAVQVHAGEALANSMSQYATHLAQLRRYPLEEGMQTVVAMALRLRDERHRARVYASFVLASRDASLARQDQSPAELEELEGRLVRLFVEADPKPAVHSEVQRCLNQQVAAEELLTHNKLAEKIMWEAMHADSAEDYMQVVRGGLDACVQFWLSAPHAELDAIVDVSRIIMRRALPALGLGENNANNNTHRIASSRNVASASPPITDMERSECTFWFCFSEALEAAREHTKAAGSLGAAHASATRADRTLLFQLRQDEARLLAQLLVLTQKGVRHGGAVVHRSRECATAVLWLVQQFTEDVTLNLLCADAAAQQHQKDESQLGGYMQAVFALVEELDEGGYLTPSILPEVCAADLYSRIRTMRVTYGKQVHRRQVQAALDRVSRGGASDAEDALVV